MRNSLSSLPATLALILTASCYQPTLRECTVTCSSQADCTRPFTCQPDGYCGTKAQCWADAGDGGDLFGERPGDTANSSDSGDAADAAAEARAEAPDDARQDLPAERGDGPEQGLDDGGAGVDARDDSGTGDDGGRPNDIIPVPADYDGDGRTDIARWRSGDGTWLIVPTTDKPEITVVFGSPGQVPVPGDYDGDGFAELGVWDPSDGAWRMGDPQSGTELHQTTLGQTGDIPVPRDYDGDGRLDVAVWRPSTGQWSIRLSSTDSVIRTTLGGRGRIPVPADYDGDGRADLAVFTPTSQLWQVRQSSDAADLSTHFGEPGDLPVLTPGDYDYDQKADMALVRPSDGRWQFRSSIDATPSSIWASDEFGDEAAGSRFVPADLDGDGYLDRVWWGADQVMSIYSSTGTSALPPFRDKAVLLPGHFEGGEACQMAVWAPAHGVLLKAPTGGGDAASSPLGKAGDRVVVGDYDGDGKSDFAVWTPRQKSWVVKLASGAPDLTDTFGDIADLPLAGDFDGDGLTDLALWRASTGTWLVRQSNDHFIQETQYGRAGDVPVARDYDGDGKADLAVWRPSPSVEWPNRSADWFIRFSRDGGEYSIDFGELGDSPRPADFDGDGWVDVALWRPTEGHWYVLYMRPLLASPQEVRMGDVQYGELPDNPMPCDFDGDGSADVGVWRPAQSTWFTLYSYMKGETNRRFDLLRP